MTVSKDEYLKASRALATGFGPTVDFADGSVGTTAQSEGGIGASGEDLPGQVFSVDQLPDPKVAVAFGLPAVVIPEHLILESSEEAESHIQGKDALDIANSRVNGLRAELKEPVLAFDGKVKSAEESLEQLSALVDNRNGGDEDTDDTGSGRPIDTEGVQQPDAGGTDSVKAADGGTEDSKGDGKGGTKASGKKQGDDK